MDSLAEATPTAAGTAFLVLEPSSSGQKSQSCNNNNPTEVCADSAGGHPPPKKNVGESVIIP